MDSKIQTCMNERNSTRRERCANAENVSGAHDVIELSIRRLDEAVVGATESLTTRVAAGHSCLTTLVCHSLAAFVLISCECRGGQQTRHCRHSAED